MDAHPVEGGYLLVPVYGPRSDWVRNVLESGVARLRANGEEVDLAQPRLIDRQQAEELVSEDVALPPRVLRIHQFLRMNRVAER